MKFWAALGAPSVKRSASMLPRSVAMMARVVMGKASVGWGRGWGARADRLRRGDRHLGHRYRLERGVPGLRAGVGHGGDGVDRLHARRHLADDLVVVVLRRAEGLRGGVVQDDE